MLKVLLAVSIALAVLAGAWLYVSAQPFSQAKEAPFGEDVMHANRLLGEWLMERSFPLAPCTTREKAGTSLESFVTGRVEGSVGEMYQWTDAQGEVHFVDEPGLVPEKYRHGAKVDSLPKLDVYRGEYSKVRRSMVDVKPLAPRPSSEVALGGRIRAIVYTAEWCTACRDTKALLRGLGVVVEERDIDKDARAMGELAGLAGKDASIPVTILGKKVIGGFDEPLLRKTVAELARQ